MDVKILQTFIHELAGSTDKRFTLFIFILPRGFPHEHGTGITGTHTKNDRTPILAELTFDTSTRALLHVGQGFILTR
jgi:hypothetical protein